MSMRKIGVLHPGEMGVAVARTAVNSGHEVYWISEGRSPETQKRAANAGLQDAGSLARLCQTCDAIVSVCPPEFADRVADEVAGHSFRGLYVDANAIAPDRACRMSDRLGPAGVRFVDGCVIGLPATERGQTWLYFSGSYAEEAAAFFTAGPLEAEVLPGPIGRASALKMCFAAHAKGLAALRATVLAAAAELGVAGELERQWGRSNTSHAAAVKSVQHTAPKAWRFVAEMHEIAATLESVGLPGGFHLAAAEIYGRLAPFKGVSKPELADTLRVLSARRLRKQGGD